MPAPLTKPAQPLRNPAEELTISTAVAHTHPLTLVFTFVTFYGLGQLVSWGGGGGRGNGCSVLPELRVKDKGMLLL